INVTANDEHFTRTVDISESDSVTGTDASYTFNVSHAELDTVPGDANGTTTIEVNAWGEDTSTDTVNTTTDTFDVETTFHEDYAVVYAGDAAANDNVNGLEVDTETDEPIVGFLGSTDAITSVEADNVGLGDNASGTTVHVIVANTSDEDAFGQAEDAKLFGSYESGDYMPSHQVLVEDHAQAAFNTETPDALADDYTYATVDERGGHDAYAIHFADDYEGETSVDVETHANNGYGPIQKRQVQMDAYESGLASWGL
ncbi:MAG: hypothetical protein V5A16_05590, partial [Haloplanus sp.]